jgi:methyltransferase (TIGR00027 family)
VTKDVAIKDVSDTAFMVAVYRSMESDRPDALFRDPLSAKLAGERGKTIVESFGGGIFRRRNLASRSRIMAWTMAMRTRIIDDYILASIARGTEAVVNLGAGLDTRPYRMALPEALYWVEVDYPHVIELKDTRLSDEQPRCHLERVKLDLADVSARQGLFEELQARFRRVLVLTEGVIPYLPVEAVGRLADDLQSRNCFQQWIADYLSPEAIKYARRGALRQQLANAPFLFDPDDYFGFFESHGWHAVEVKYLSDEGQRLKRPIPLPFVVALWLMFAGLFKSAQRRGAGRRFMGYALFERVAGPSVSTS